ncbi:MAG TPA: VCBS repeat-containing protein, partial [Candidatus Kapabacteria bacterium]|nr:VCBS repeat-containing protein [Candidatus Kapabacteria bacterium]
AMAQENAASLPELQEWYSLKNTGYGIYSLNHLPNFSLPEGKNTLSLDGKHIIYNRFPFDTTNQYPLPNFNGIWLDVGDFNGDGIQDVIAQGNRIYFGVENGKEPPTEKPLIVQGSMLPYVGDYNGDGYDDFFSDEQTLILGNKERSKFQSVHIPYNDTAFSPYNKNIRMILYPYGQNESRELHFAIYHDMLTGSGRYVLYYARIQFEELQPDSIIAKGTLLDSLEYVYDANHENGFYPQSSVVQHINGETRFALQDLTSTRFFYLTNTFEEFRTWEHTSVYKYVLKHSIDGDTIPDWCEYKGNFNGSFLKMYHGPLGNDTIPFAEFNFQGSGLKSVVSLFDVNNDNINDIAFTQEYGNNSRFSILLGAKRITDVHSDTITSEYIGIPKPMPSTLHKSFVLPLSIQSSTNIQINLYSLQGVKITELYHSSINQGEYSLTVPIPQYITSGHYILQIQTNRNQYSRSFILQE